MNQGDFEDWEFKTEGGLVFRGIITRGSSGRFFLKVIRDMTRDFTWTGISLDIYRMTRKMAELELPSLLSILESDSLNPRMLAYCLVSAEFEGKGIGCYLSRLRWDFLLQRAVNRVTFLFSEGNVRPEVAEVTMEDHTRKRLILVNDKWVEGSGQGS